MAESRKIQFVGNSTFIVSLPKKWVLKSNLKEKSELFLNELSTGELILSPKISEISSFSRIELNADELGLKVFQSVFSAFYLGFERIKIFSNKEMSHAMRAELKETLRHLSGAEIVSESPKEITLRVFHDKTKIELNQLLSRTGLVLSDLIHNCLERKKLDEIKRDEDELDRLYHLSAKIITLSQVDFNILNSSGIKKNLLIVPYFLVAKRLENLGDSIENIALNVIEGKVSSAEIKPLLFFFESEIMKCVKALTAEKDNLFCVMAKEKEKETEKLISKTSVKVKDRLLGMLKYLVDIQEEIVIINFYKKLMKEKLYE